MSTHNRNKQNYLLIIIKFHKIRILFLSSDGVQCNQFLWSMIFFCFSDCLFHILFVT